MRYLIFATMGIFLLVAPRVALAQARPGNAGFGAGIILGEPTGLSAKYFFDPHWALDVDLAFSFIDEAVYPTVDGLYHFGSLTSGSTWVRPYIGGGAMMRADNGDEEDDDDRRRDRDNDEDSFSAGLRFTAGVSILFTPPIEIFADISPGTWIVPETEFELAAGLGARYYF